MKAAQINEYGGPEVLQLSADAPKPTPKPGQVLIEVHAASVNPFDNKVRAGSVQQWMSLDFPATLGGDVAGVVSELGEGTQGFQVGDEVYGQANSVSGQGSFAEFTPVAANSLAHKPKSLDFAESAAVPLAASSARQALVEHIDLQPGQKILIHGGAGGIGMFAVQLAKHIGAYVATTVSDKNVEFVTQLGADEVIDYKTQDFVSLISDYDAVFDTVGGETTAKSYAVLKPGGILVTMVAAPPQDTAERNDITVIAQQSKVTSEGLTEIATLIDGGVLKVYVDKVFPLDKATDAVAYLESGSHRGKVVITVK